MNPQVRSNLVSLGISFVGLAATVGLTTIVPAIEASGACCGGLLASVASFGFNALLVWVRAKRKAAAAAESSNLEMESDRV